MIDEVDSIIEEVDNKNSKAIDEAKELMNKTDPKKGKFGPYEFYDPFKNL